ncbi:hypothetical protein ACQP1P_20945 [Dactylosporangium sp. CA-052675]|uniref:hypothetical protein n=1 Tax=Dactylosporangium sp. CA-052675 TaxID=3239927 RepID=UPI003D93D655
MESRRPGRGLPIAACLLFTVLVVVRLGDVNNTEAAGISICLLEAVALVLHLRAGRRFRAYRYTGVALGLLVVAGIGFSIAFTTGDKSWGTGDKSWGPATVLAIVPRTLATPVLLLGLLSFAAKPLDRRARWKLAMDASPARCRRRASSGCCSGPPPAA